MEAEAAGNVSSDFLACVTEPNSVYRYNLGPTGRSRSNPCPTTEAVTEPQRCTNGAVQLVGHCRGAKRRVLRRLVRSR